MPNLLTTQAGLKLGPIVLETFFKHYLERKSDTNDEHGSVRSTNLRRDDLLWQEAFEIVKSFLNQASKHTVEELQEFSNARIPSPPWIWVDRVLVPMSSCDAAATYLIKALGGEAFTKRVVGGTKWWQVRGLRGVDCQWICQKSHLQEARKRKRGEGNNGSRDSTSPSSSRFPSYRRPRNRQTSPRADNANGAQKHGEQTEEDEREKAQFPYHTADMDGTRCMLYAHGGGYYFGSIDQERYCMQRYARKIHGRVFAVNYRLAPQYPFPCAIQDMLAAYLYLIDPPPNAKHAPIPPQSIVLAGDSAGGGLCLATLQVIRDSGLPLPAAAVLVSPWCDLTHSFPSTIQNTNTDIIPPYGLCLHKPSVLWPPPPKNITSKVRAGLRARFTKVAKRAVYVEAVFSNQANVRPPAIGGEANNTAGSESYRDTHVPKMAEVILDPALSVSKDSNPGHSEQHKPDSPVEGAAVPPPPRSPVIAESGYLKEDDGSDAQRIAGKPPLPWGLSDSFRVDVDGKPVIIDSQIQLYCPNSLLMHPLISPALGYLGGLPPLLVIASDKEVLRDEIIYIAHKAAHPDRFPVNEDSKMLYPPLHDIEGRHRPTPVHLQVYDETAHVLPLFAFTTPAKYCYRAIALFAKHFTSLPRSGEPLIPSPTQTATPESERPSTIPEEVPLPSSPSLSASDSEPHVNSPETKGVFAVLRSHSSRFRGQSTGGTKSPQSSGQAHGASSDISRDDSGDVAGHRFKTSENQPQGPGVAGHPAVYTGLEWPLQDMMICERVSTSGALRPLEPESEIPALNLESDHIGKVNEAAARRYIEGNSIWTKKFAKTAKKIEMQRQKNLTLAKDETIRTVKTMAQFQEHLFREQDKLEASGGYHHKESAFSLHRNREERLRKNTGDAERGSWSWSWALDDEHPPPSSIVSRRDTVEARNLARVADLSVEQEESKMSGNMLWSVLVNFLTTHPSHKEDEAEDREDDNEDATKRHQGEGENKAARTKRGRIFRRLALLGKRREQSPGRDFAEPTTPT